MNLDKQSNSILRNLYFDPKNFGALKLLAEQMRIELRKQPITNRETAWQTAERAITREERAKGIQLFLDEIKNTALQENEERKGKHNNNQ